MALEKPGRRDRSSPRSYQLISLLSSVGKALERAVARRLSWQAIQQCSIPKRYFGALPCRSATDLTTLLTQDVEETFEGKERLSIVTFDIKGGFDTILPNCLLHRLLEQRWPHYVVRWVSNFLAKRKASLRLDDCTDMP